MTSQPILHSNTINRVDETKKIVRFLAEHPLFKNSTLAEIKQVAMLVEVKKYAVGDVLVEEGTALSCLGIIISGAVNITRQYRKGDMGHEELQIEDQTHKIQQLGSGHLFGEMTFVAGETTAASLIAVEPTEALLIEKEKLMGNDPLLISIHNSIVAFISTVLVKRLRQTNQEFTNSLQKNLIQEKLRVNAGKLIILIIIATGINNIADFLVQKLHLNPANRLVVWGMLILFALPSLYILNNSNYSKADVGLDFSNWRPTLKRGLIISVILAILLMGTKYLLIDFGTITAQGPFIDFTEFLAIEPFYLSPILYMVSSAIQEFMTKGVLQGGIHRFLGQEHGFLAVIISSLFFSFLHFHFGVVTIFLVLIGGVFFGLIYLKDKNILGVTIVHYVLGLMMSALGLMS